MTLDYTLYPQVHLYDGAHGWYRYHTTCLAEAVRQHLAAGRRLFTREYSDGSIGRPTLMRREGFCERTQNAIESFPTYEWYQIEEVDGQKYLHPSFCVWTNDGREDDDGRPMPVTVTEYTNCYIPLDEFFFDSDDRWSLMVDAEGEVQQYEGDYTIEEAIELGYDKPQSCPGMIGMGKMPSVKYLELDQINCFTPCGAYYTEE